jgi:predicted permease
MRILSAIGHAARFLRREPGYALVTVLALGLGIGANTAIFSIVNGVLLRPLDFPAPERLVELREVLPALAKTYPVLPVAGRHFVEWRQRAASFESIALMDPGSVNLTGTGEPERLESARVSYELFDTLGVRPPLGRGFLPGEDQEGHEKVAVISDSLWRGRFQADPDILGRTITLDNEGYDVVGVLPRGFFFPGSRASSTGRIVPVHPDVYTPKVLSKEELRELMGRFNYSAIGRLRPGVSREQASAELNVIGAQLTKMSGENVDLRASVTPLRDSVVAGSQRGLLVLLGAVGAVLVIVCVNLANLALARAERRRRESAIRTALGASRGRLVGQALAESLGFAFLGGVVGVAIARACLGALLASAPAEIPRLDSVHLDGWVFAFALAVTTATGLLFGLAPAWRSASSDPHDALRATTQTTTSGARVIRLRGALIALQTGLALVLVVTAALLSGSLLRLVRADMGYAASTVLTVDLAIPWTKYREPDERNQFYERLLEGLKPQPGVASAAVVTALPLEGETWVDFVAVAGSDKPSFTRPSVNVRFVSADYFSTMGIPLTSGRTFAGTDRGRRVAVISDKVARMLWPGQNPVGRKFERNPKDEFEVIGVVGDVRADADRPPVAMVYRPYWESAPRSVKVVARAIGDPRSIAGAIRSAIRGMDGDVPIPRMRTMAEVLDESVATRRFQMLLAELFAGIALLVAALGTYGVVSYSVARRRNEMGIRMALGAQPATLAGLVIRQGMFPVLLGLAGGLAVSLAGGRVLGSLLYEVSASDPVTMGGAVCLLALVGAAACLVPARRATRVDPLSVLRYE